MSKKQIKILFILPSLAAGGAERIMSFIASKISKTQFNTKLVITGFKNKTVYQTEGLEVIYLNKSRVLKSGISLYKLIKKENPEIVISSIVHLNTFSAFFSLFFPNIKFIAREANVLSVLNKHNPTKNLLFSKNMVVFAYKLVDKIICQSRDMQKDVVTNYGVPLEKTVLINNPITNSFQTKKLSRNLLTPIKFITVTRLSKHKGHERIINALAKLNFPFHYTIIGKGLEKDNILNLINKYNLNEKVEYIEYTHEVSKYLSESDLYLQGSFVEGFPNILIESCVVGTPILAFNAPGGLDEIIESGINGYIVNSIDEFVTYLNNINSTYSFNPEKVSNVVKERFGEDKIINEYENLFLNLVN
ncbi:glycosyltransferase [Xanthomarina spongicola]|uniref:Glycosyltransferase involved in cell wall biosynthesis n=1 Tax=Xanthomarina spongicola TaxID=570520 RepID=A0A316DPG0_9FLAO|nr:glycosyltransferase [Xanthomarina spongicola]PWK19961.1 glycosyltransferase involved in cell wall biosynthesis [Xanthomarina spongicola]